MEVKQAPPAQTWKEKHQRDVQHVTNLLLNNKAVLVEGDTHSGKTTLATFVSKALEEKFGNNTQTVFTTPAVQETLGTKDVEDRTGVKFKRLPSPSTLAQLNGPVIIVIDEISERKPDEAWIDNWNTYINLENTHFLLLAHPGKEVTNQWMELFSAHQASKYSLRI